MLALLHFDMCFSKPVLCLLLLVVDYIHMSCSSDCGTRLFIGRDPSDYGTRLFIGRDPSDYETSFQPVTSVPCVVSPSVLASLAVPKHIRITSEFTHKVAI